MSNQRTNNEEFQNVLDVATRADLPVSAKELIIELFERVKALEAEVEKLRSL